MINKTKILIAEHDPSDLELLHDELIRGGIKYTAEVVQNEQDYITALKTFIPDIILADYSFPSFDGLSAFKIKERIAQATPFIIVSGTIGDEKSIELIKSGVTDYVLKDKLFTLITKIKRALKEAKERQQKNKADLELKESEKKYRQIVETAQEGIWLIDENNCTTLVNQKMADILGYTIDEMIGKENYFFMDEEWKKKATDHIADRKLGVNATHDFKYITKSGKEVYTSLATNPVFDDAGNYDGALAMVIDITERKELENLLNKANKLARIGSWEVDLVKGTVYWSEITKQIHETEPAYIPDLETGISFYKEGNDRELIRQKVNEAIEKGAPWDVELQIITTLGNSKWIRFIGEAEWANGKVVRINGSFQDIDARKKSEFKVAEVLAEKNTILESIDDAFFAVDKNWIVTYWNMQAEKVLQKLKNEMLGHNLWDVFSDSMDSISYKKYHQAIETVQSVHFEDFYPPLSTWYEISAYPSGNGLSVYFKNVSERKLTEIRLKGLNEDLQKQAKKLVISNEELERFAYVASHDLQEPLRMITSFLTQLEKKYGDIIDEKGKQYIGFAVDGAKRMRQIILDLLEFSRVGRTEDQHETVDLNELVKEIRILFRKNIEEKNAIIAADELPVIHAYQSPLRQVFQNLVSNALKYSRVNVPVQIHISVKELDDHWQFAVKDNGLGIAGEYFDKIFIIFQRLHNKDEFSGTGMGLAITKKIIESHDGKIWVESEEGIGSTFFFTVKRYKD